MEGPLDILLVRWKVLLVTGQNFCSVLLTSRYWFSVGAILGTVGC